MEQILAVIAWLKKPLMTTERTRSRDSKFSVLVDLDHLRQFSMDIYFVILNDAERVNPNQMEIEISSYFKSIQD